MGDETKPSVVVGAAIEEAHAKAEAVAEQTSAAVDDLTAAAAEVLERLRRRTKERALRLVKAVAK